MNRIRFSNTLFAGIMLCALLLTACGGAAQPAATTDPATAGQALLAKIPDITSDQPQADKTFVGAVKGTQALIGIVVQNDVVAGYMCDGTDVSQWFTGKVANNKIDLTNAKGTRLVADVGADSVNGTVTLTGGQPLSFTTAPAVKDVSGLYRQKVTKDNITAVNGWVIAADGARGLSEVLNGLQGGLALTANAPSKLRILSDDHEYTISFEGVGRNLRKLSVLELSVATPGQVGFDVFCGQKKTFVGVNIPKGTTITVLVTDKCEPTAGPPEPSSGSSPAAVKQIVIRPPFNPKSQ